MFYVLVGAAVTAPVATFVSGLAWAMLAGNGWNSEALFVTIVTFAVGSVGVFRYRRSTYQGALFMTTSVLGAALSIVLDPARSLDDLQLVTRSRCPRQGALHLGFEWRMLWTR